MEHEIWLGLTFTFFVKLICIFLPFSNTFKTFPAKYPCSRTQINKFVCSISFENRFIFVFGRCFQLNPQIFLNQILFLFEVTCNLDLTNQFQVYFVIFSRFLQHPIYKYVCLFIKNLTLNSRSLLTLLLLLYLRLEGEETLKYRCISRPPCGNV